MSAQRLIAEWYEGSQQTSMPSEIASDWALAPLEHGTRRFCCLQVRPVGDWVSSGRTQRILSRKIPGRASITGSIGRHPPCRHMYHLPAKEGVWNLRIDEKEIKATTTTTTRITTIGRLARAQMDTLVATFETSPSSNIKLSACCRRRRRIGSRSHRINLQSPVAPHDGRGVVARRLAALASMTWRGRPSAPAASN